MKEIIYKCDACGEEKPMVYSTEEAGYCAECTSELEAEGLSAND